MLQVVSVVFASFNLLFNRRKLSLAHVPVTVTLVSPVKETVFTFEVVIVVAPRVMLTPARSSIIKIGILFIIYKNRFLN